MRSFQSIQALHAERAQRAVRLELERELDGTAAHFAIFDVLALAARRADAGSEAFTAIRALHGHEDLGLGAGHARLEDGLEAVETVDVFGVAAGDAARERFDCGGLAWLHSARILPERPSIAGRLGVLLNEASVP